MARARLRMMIVAFSGLLIAAGLTVVMAAPAAAIPGLVNVTVTSPLNSANKATIAPCPAGLKVVGGGARLTFATGEVAITYMAPTPAGDGFEARANEDVTGYGGNWGLVVTAICANPPAGYVIVTATSAPASPTTAQALAFCPSGTEVIGSGGAVFPGGNILLSNMLPTGRQRVAVMGSEARGGYAGNWTVQAWAICTAVLGHTWVNTTGAANSLSPKTNTSTCPAGQSVHSVGFQLGGSTPDLFLNAAYPNPAAPVGTGVPVTFSEGQAGLVGFWAIGTMAICSP
jgi:hypothetical protein